MNVTPAAARVLRAFLEDPAAPHYGFELMRKTKLASGSLYPLLARLEKQGIIEARQENIDPSAEGRPARRYYVITGEGSRAARIELAELAQQVSPPGWVPGRPVAEGGF